MDKKDYLKLLELSDILEKRVSLIFDRLNNEGLLDGNFYNNKMNSIEIDNLSKDYIEVTYYDADYDIYQERSVEIPVELLSDDKQLNNYINDKVNTKLAKMEAARLNMEKELTTREYNEYMRLKQKFES